MGRTKKEKEIKLPANKVKAVITTDSHIFFKDPKTNALLPLGRDNDSFPEADVLYYLISEGEERNRENGINYIVTKALLEKYRMLSQTCLQDSRIREQFCADQNTLHFSETEIRNLLLDNDEVYPLIQDILEESAGTWPRWEKFFCKPDNIDLSLASVRLVKEGVRILKESPNVELQLQADIIQYAYIDPDTWKMTEEEIRNLLNVKKDRYFAQKKNGISNLSAIIFGVFPGERGCLNPDDEKCQELVGHLGYAKKDKIESCALQSTEIIEIDSEKTDLTPIK